MWVAVIPSRCACRWTSKVKDYGWLLEKSHPNCLVKHTDPKNVQLLA